MILRLFVLALLWLPLACPAGQTVFVVESYHADFHWDKAYKKALTDAFAGRYTLEFFEMDTKRLPVEQHAEMARKALERIVATHPALVVMGDDAALKYLGPALDRLDIPGVYLGINGNPRQYGQGSFRHITGILERPLIKRGLSFIRQIVPDTTKVLLLFDVDLTSGVIRDEVFSGRTSVLIDGIEVNLQLCPTLADWKTAVSEAAARGYQVTVVGLYQALRGSDGKVVDADEVIHWTSANTSMPLFALWDFSVGAEMTVGGLVMSGSEQGRAAASMALEILEGKATPSSLLPVVARQGDFVFSRKQLERFRLRLPPDIARQARLVD